MLNALKEIEKLARALSLLLRRGTRHIEKNQRCGVVVEQIRRLSIEFRPGRVGQDYNSDQAESGMVKVGF